jgi:hypothetical protein
MDKVELPEELAEALRRCSDAGEKIVLALMEELRSRKAPEIISFTTRTMTD